MTDSRPIVVGGCYRSGTSLVRHLLDAHPRIYCGPEVKFFRDFHGDYIEDPIRHVRFMATARSMLAEEELFDVLGGAFVTMHERAADASGKQRWADKVPENVVFLDGWSRLLGDRWVFLHVVRNPLDTLASIAEHRFPVSVPAGLEARIDLYLEYARAGLDFEAAHPSRYRRLLYEDLVARPEQTIRDTMQWLGEEFDPRQLALDPSGRETGLEDPNVKRTTAIHRDSVDRWRRDLSPDQVQAIVKRTAAVWGRLDPAGTSPLPQS